MSNIDVTAKTYDLPWLAQATPGTAPSAPPGA